MIWLFSIIFNFLLVISFFAIPIELIVLFVKFILRKKCKTILKTTGITVLTFVLCLIISLFTDPTVQCEHQYSITNVIEANCTDSGYTEKQCVSCKKIIKTDTTQMLGHSPVEYFRTEPSRDEEGVIVKRCERCDYEEIETIAKLPPLTYIEGVDYEEIYLAYKENELRADETYQYNRYRITAKINGISTGGLYNITGGATLTMETKVGNTIVFFITEFEKEQEENLKLINKGDTITFEGKCLSAGNWSECEIILE